MASALCGCSKKSRHDRSSVYVVSASDELTARPPTTISHVAPVTQHSLTDSVVLGSVRRPAVRGGEHVERYLAGGGTAITVSVRQQNRHHHRHHDRRDDTVNNDGNDDDVRRQLSNYDAVLDEYLNAAIAAHNPNISNHSDGDKVHTYWA